MPQAAQESAARQKPIVLFLDDSPDMLELYEACFGGNGYVVLTVSQGAKAIQLAKAHPVSVAVVDYEMPEMNGHEVALALKRIRPALPVIMVSGHPSVPPEVMQDVDFFLPKCSSQRRLSEIIDTFVRC
jgi:two-component system cell cycle sensor histidine kinase/response regulator CckA